MITKIRTPKQIIRETLDEYRTHNSTHLTAFLAVIITRKLQAGGWRIVRTNPDTNEIIEEYNP